MEKWQTGERVVRVLIPGEQANSRGAEAMGVRPDMRPGFAPVTADEAGLDTHGMLTAAKEGELKALYVASANLVGTFPDEALVREALENVPFLVVQELFMTETAKYADVILPAAEFPAKTGSYTNFEGRVQHVEQVMAPTGDTRTDGDIFRAVAEAMDEKLINSEQEFQWEMQHLLERITQDGLLVGVPTELLTAAAEQQSQNDAVDQPEGTLRLVAVDRLYGGGGTAHFDRLFSYVQPAAEALVHSDDAVAYELVDGDVVELTGGAGTIECTVRIVDDVAKGTVQVPKGVVAAPVNRLQHGEAFPLVRVRKRVLEEVG